MVRGFRQGVFAAQFEHGADISDEAVLQGALRACGVPPKDWLERAHEDATKAELRALTDQAQALGPFGAPSLVFGNEVFWGDDRLEDAITWAVAADGARSV